MRTWIAAAAILMVPAFVATVGAPAHAQLLGGLKNATGTGQGGSSGGLGLGGLSMPSVGSASSGNIAGVLRYCVQNNYVAGSGASSVESSLTSKLGAGATTSNPQFASGEQGTLQTGNGQDVSLGGGGLKGQMTQKVCKLVLQHAKSLI